MIQVARPFFRNKSEILGKLAEILDSGRLMGGEMTENFEKEFSAYTGTKYALSVNSCTTALEIVLRFLDVKDREVIISTNTFIATGNAVLFAGGRPVLSDIKGGTYNLDVTEVEKKITPKTKAVIITHIAGIISDDIEYLKKLCTQKGIVLIEDCAHAVGASFKDTKAGKWGYAGCFSFYPTKIMTTGTGGMITTDSDDLYEFAQSVRCHGRGRAMSEIIHIGNDWFMDEIRAAVGLYQLRDLESMLDTRKHIAHKYCELLKAVKEIRVLPVSTGSVPSYYKFPVQLDSTIDAGRFKNEFRNTHNIELESVYWPVCHLQPVYRDLFGHREGDFPVAEKVLKQQITLPIHPFITDEDAEYVVNSLKEVLCG